MVSVPSRRATQFSLDQLVVLVNSMAALMRLHIVPDCRGVKGRLQAGCNTNASILVRPFLQHKLLVQT